MKKLLLFLLPIVLLANIVFADYNSTANTHFTFNQTASPMLNDGTDGALYNATGTGTFGGAGKLNNSYTFTSEKLNTPSIPSAQINVSSNFSYMVWFKKSGNPAGGLFFARIGSIENNNNNRFGFDLEASGALRAEMTEFSVASLNVQTSYSIANNQWYWLYAEVKGMNLSFWVNNTFIGTTDISGAQGFLTNGNITLGGVTGTFPSSELDDFRYYNRTLASDERAFIYNNFLGTENITYYNTTASEPPSLPVVNFNTPPTPTNNSLFYQKNETLTINASSTNGLFDIYLTIYNSTGTAIKGFCTGCTIIPPSIYTSLSASPTNSLQTTINTSFYNLTTGIYYYNVTISNSTYLNISETRTFTIYNITQNGFINPFEEQNISNKTITVAWQQSTINPSSNINVSYNLSLYNNTGFIRTINTTNTNSFTINNFYTYQLRTGDYYFNLTTIDANNNKVNQITNFNMLTNTLINITATGIGVGSISNFTVNAYNSQNNFNTTKNTTTGYLEIDQIQGIVNLSIDAPNFAINENNYIGLNITSFNYSYQFSLYQTNVFNITFFDEKTPTTKLIGPTINLEIISNLYSNNYSTTNGSLYIPLLIPETYIMRYSAPGYTTRFYEFTLVNRSYNLINLYLLNSTGAFNFTVYIVNEVLNPVEGAVVKNLKYNLANNTYILQEIGITDIQGKAKFSVTFNDEFYKQMVEYNGILRKTTEPDYIDTASITIPISLLDINIIEDLVNYDGINGVLVFNNATNNFRFDWSDGSLIASQYCMNTYRMVNGSQNLYNSSCSSGASSGTILQGVANESGSVYYSRITYTESSTNKYLTSLYYEYPSSLSEKPLGNKYGLFIQFILTMGMSSLAVLNLPFAMIIAPFSLILGKILGWNMFSWAGLLAIQVVGIILAIMASMRR